MKRSLLVITFFGMFASISLAGNLEPSAPPASTMKPLDQVEPRTAITSLPYTISVSGSYYLTGSLSCGGNGITVSVNNVTIDLMGFTMTGSGSGAGIYMNGRSNVEIRNGTITNFETGIYEASTNGRTHRVIDIRATNHVRSGIHLIGQGHEVRNCMVSGCGANITGSSGNGIFAGKGAKATGNLVQENGYRASASYNSLYASDGSTIVENTIVNNGTEATGTIYGILTGNGSTLSGNSVLNNGSTGASVYGICVSNGCSVVGNSVYGNGAGATGTSRFGIWAGGSCILDQNTSFNTGMTNLSYSASCVLGTNVPMN